MTRKDCGHTLPQIKHSGIDHQIIEMRIVMLSMILCLHVVFTGAIFHLNTRTGSIHVQSFTACHVGNVQLQGSHHADMQHVALSARSTCLPRPTITM